MVPMACLVLVDSFEGPMPQTKFVLGKALRLGLRPIVVINKVDKPDQRADEVLNETFDLFAALDAHEDQLDFPVLYASAKQGWAAEAEEGPRASLDPLFDLIVRHVAPPKAEPAKPFRMLATTLEANPYLGRILTGRIEEGVVEPNTTLKALAADGSVIEQTRITKVLAFRGLERVPVERAEAGDLVALAGFARATVADTLCAAEVSEPLAAQPIDPATLVMTFAVNDGPLAGQEGDKVTSRMILERLTREAEGNVALKVGPSEEDNAFEVRGRGELQMAVLIETMRREGYELVVGRPRVLFREDANGRRLEPIDEVIIDVDEEFAGAVVEKLGRRKGELVEMRPAGAGKQRLVVHAPTRALIGYLGEFLTDTRGTGVMNRVFHGWAPHKGPIDSRRTGVLVSMAQGESVAYALWNLEDRGPLFVEPGERIYTGMVVGEHTRGNDLDVNPLKGKQLTNVRASGKDDAVTLTPVSKMTLERAISYITDDELVEITPKSIRLRKRWLDVNERKRQARRAVA